MVVTQSQMSMSCFKAWYYKYFLWLDEFQPPLGAGEPEYLRIGKELHSVMLSSETPVTDDVKVLKFAYDNFVRFDHEIEFKETEMVKWRDVRKGVVFAGRIDAIGTIDGEPCLFELKTSRYQPNDAYWQQKAMDTQLLGYSWLTGLRKVVLLHFRVSSVSKTRWGDEWFAHVLEQIKSKPYEYFSLFVLEFEEHEVEAVVRDIELWHELVVYQLAHNRFYANRSMCNEYGRTCPFWLICKGKVRAEDCSRREKFDELQPEIKQLLAELEVEPWAE